MIHHARRRIALILKWTKTDNEATYLANDERQAAVERNFIAIGEAIKDLTKSLDLPTLDPTGRSWANARRGAIRADWPKRSRFPGRKCPGCDRPGNSRVSDRSSARSVLLTAFAFNDSGARFLGTGRLCFLYPPTKFARLLALGDGYSLPISLSSEN